MFSLGCHKKQFTWFWTYISSFFYNIVMCLNIGTPKITNFAFGTNGKLKIIGVQIFKHFRVCICMDQKPYSDEEHHICHQVNYKFKSWKDL